MSYEQQYRPQGFSILPLVVKYLLLVNGLFFFATIALQGKYDLNDILGLHYFASPKFQPYQIITYMFMHGGFSHILFNMLALWMFGAQLENYWGPKRFLTFYLICGIGAAITHYVIFYYSSHEYIQLLDNYLKNPEIISVEEAQNLMRKFSADNNLMPELQNLTEQIKAATISHNPEQATNASAAFISLFKIAYLNAPVIVGASGAIFGILLAYGMLFPNTIIYFNLFIPIKAKFFVILYGALELISGILNHAGDNVAHFAHLGGMLFGFIMIMYWKRSRTNFY